MVQEIIAYVIIGAAITITVMKMVKIFSENKHAKKAKDQFVTGGHNCSDCAAECMLRNAVQKNPDAQNHTNLCGRIEIKSN